MTIRTKIKSLLANEDITMKSVAEELSKVKNRKITLDSISKKMAKDTIRYTEVEEILDLIGYEIEFKKIR